MDVTFRVCLFLVPCIFVYLTMLYREATQLVWRLSIQRLELRVCFPGFLGGWEGAHTLCKWMSYHVCRSVGVSVFSAAFPHYMGRACKLFGVHPMSGRVCVLCFLGIWLYGRGEGGAHTLCKWMSLFGCVFFWCPVFLCTLPCYIGRPHSSFEGKHPVAGTSCLFSWMRVSPFS